MIARVVVMPKPVVNDPQGLTVKQALGSLGFEDVEEVRVGKYIEMRLDADSEEAAAKSVERMCGELLANHVIEDYRFEIARGRQASPTDPLPQSGAQGSGTDSDGPGDPALPSDASSGRRLVP